MYQNLCRDYVHMDMRIKGNPSFYKNYSTSDNDIRAAYKPSNLASMIKVGEAFEKTSALKHPNNEYQQMNYLQIDPFSKVRSENDEKPLIQGLLVQDQYISEENFLPHGQYMRAMESENKYNVSKLGSSALSYNREAKYTNTSELGKKSHFTNKKRADQIKYKKEIDSAIEFYDRNPREVEQNRKGKKKIQVITPSKRKDEYDEFVTIEIPKNSAKIIDLRDEYAYENARQEKEDQLATQKIRVEKLAANKALQDIYIKKVLDPSAQQRLSVKSTVDPFDKEARKFGSEKMKEKFIETPDLETLEQMLEEQKREMKKAGLNY